MNNSELERKLKAARGPKLDVDYEGDFSRMVLSQLRSGPARVVREAGTSRRWWPRLGWALAAAVIVVVAFWAGRREGNRDALADAKVIEQTMALFPNRVRAIVRDEKGINLVLSDKEDVPVSTPIYVRICEGGRCSSMVTFSGQEIQIGGRQLTVLSQGDGGIILEGNGILWANGKPLFAQKNLKIQARNLSFNTL